MPAISAHDCTSGSQEGPMTDQKGLQAADGGVAQRRPMRLLRRPPREAHEGESEGDLVDFSAKHVPTTKNIPQTGPGRPPPDVPQTPFPRSPEEAPRGCKTASTKPPRTLQEPPQRKTYRSSEACKTHGPGTVAEWADGH